MGTRLCSASYVSWQSGTPRICCCEPCCSAAAADRRGPPAVQQSIDTSWPPGPQQQTRSSGVRWLDGTGGQMDGRTPDSCIDPAPHIMRAPLITQSWLKWQYSVRHITRQVKRHLQTVNQRNTGNTKSRYPSRVFQFPLSVCLTRNPSTSS